MLLKFAFRGYNLFPARDVNGSTSFPLNFMLDLIQPKSELACRDPIQGTDQSLT